MVALQKEEAEDKHTEDKAMADTAKRRLFDKERPLQKSVL